jgi:hypothetical protein
MIKTHCNYKYISSLVDLGHKLLLVESKGDRLEALLQNSSNSLQISLHDDEILM